MQARDPGGPRGLAVRPKTGTILLVALVIGTVGSVVGVALTVAFNWFFRGEAGLSRDEVFRLVLVCFVVSIGPVGLLWARSRKEPQGPGGGPRTP